MEPKRLTWEQFVKRNEDFFRRMVKDLDEYEKGRKNQEN